VAKLLAKYGCHLVVVACGGKWLNHTSNSIADIFEVKIITLSKDIFEKNAAVEIYDEV
jgi:short-subunit dehydrogenase